MAAPGNQAAHIQVGHGVAGAAGAAVAAVVQVPFVGPLAGWAVTQSIKLLVDLAEAIRLFPKECDDLRVFLADARVEGLAAALETLTDVPKSRNKQKPGFWQNRGKFDNLCDLLADANFLLAHADQVYAAAVCRQLPGAEVPSAAAVHSKLVELNKDSITIVDALQSHTNPTAPALTINYDIQELERRSCPHPNPAGNQLAGAPDHIFPPIAGLDLVTEVVNALLLRDTRNIGIVGMGGIGKTALARAVCDRACPEFYRVVRLEVGDDPDMVALLKSAQDQLFGAEFNYRFTCAERGLDDLVHRVCKQGRPVLLLLDDVWHSTEHAVVAALNFVTRPELRVEGSRLIVTTRQHSTLSYEPHESAAPCLDGLKLIDMPLLNPESVQNLFVHACGAKPLTGRMSGGAHEDERRQLLANCGGNALAVRELAAACTKFCCSTVKLDTHLKEWEREVDEVCGRSVDDTALPPSLKDCFIAFAAFPPGGAGVPRSALLQLLATHAPLRTPESLSTVEHKLKELVHHSLVREGEAEQFPGGPRGPVYSMHPILHRIAVKLAAPESTPCPGLRCFGCVPSKVHGGSVRYLSLHNCRDRSVAVEDVLGKQSGNARSLLRKAANAFKSRTDPASFVPTLLACIIPSASVGHAPRWPPRLRHLDLRGARVRKKLDRKSRPPIGKNLDNAESRSPLLVLNSLCLAQTTAAARLLPCILPAAQLEHLELCGCTCLEALPESIGDCNRLTHLDLSGCTALEKLPESIPQCKQLQHLSLRGCSSLQTPEECVGCCPQLSYLDFSGCVRMGRLPMYIRECLKLEHLKLRGCSVLQSLPMCIGVCSSLTHLDLKECRQLSSLPGSIEHCHNLTYFNREGCSDEVQQQAVELLNVPQPLEGGAAPQPQMRMPHCRARRVAAILTCLLTFVLWRRRRHGVQSHPVSQLT